MGASNPEKSAKTVAPRPAASPEELIKDLELKVTEDDHDKIKGGAVDYFINVPVKGESTRLR